MGLRDVSKELQVYIDKEHGGVPSRAANALGVSPSSVVWALRGKPSPMVQNALSQVVREVEFVPQPIQVDPCPDCGGVHLGRCEGQPVRGVKVVTSRARETKTMRGIFIEKDDAERWDAFAQDMGYPTVAALLRAMKEAWEQGRLEIEIGEIDE